jgi:gas vesicle protein
MSHHDDMPYVIIERRSGSASAFLWGGLIGAAAAMLLAPRSGRETRNEIRAGALRLRDRAEDAVRAAGDTLNETLGEVKGEVNERFDAAREAFDAGRKAARETRDDVEVRVREVRAGVRGGVDAARRHQASGDDVTGPAPDGDPDFAV